MSLPGALWPLANAQHGCSSPFRVAGTQKGCTFTFLPSFVKFRAGQSQDDGLSVAKAGRRKHQLSCHHLIEMRECLLLPGRKKWIFHRAVTSRFRVL